MMHLVHSFFRIMTTVCGALVVLYYGKKHFYQSLKDQYQDMQRDLDVLDGERARIKKEYTVLLSGYTKDLQLGDRLLQCIKRWGDVHRQQQHDRLVMNEQHEARMAVHVKKIADSLHRQALMRTAATQSLAQTRAQLTQMFASQEAGQAYLAQVIAACKEKVDGTN